MEWTADVSAGAWIRERLDGGLSASMHGVVPRGFPAYARIFHPATRDRPVGMPWPPLPSRAHAREWAAFDDAAPEIDVERVSWADASAAFGTVMHPLAQWGDLVERFRQAEGEDGPRDAAGWRYHAPDVGSLAPDVVARAAARLAEHTSVPDGAVVALWTGWGGLLGHVGDGPSRAFVQLTDDPADPETLERHNAMLSRSIPDRFNNVFRQPSWQPGILSDEVSRGPRLELPAREYILFTGSVAELARPDWVLDVPWRDRVAEAHGFAPDAQSPSLVWPADRTWVLVTEVDFDSTVVGGSRELIAALCADSGLEALRIPAGADLTWDGDTINR